MIDQDKVNLLSPGDMRLQVINPSNKLEMADPVQVKTLITAEQDPNDKDIQDTISKYNDAIKNRQDLNFKNLSNLLKINHASFLKYAQASLDSSQSNSQLREFFETGEDGFSLYELNNPVSYK